MDNIEMRVFLANFGTQMLKISTFLFFPSNSTWSELWSDITGSCDQHFMLCCYTLNTNRKYSNCPKTKAQSKHYLETKLVPNSSYFSIVVYRSVVLLLLRTVASDMIEIQIQSGRNIYSIVLGNFFKFYSIKKE